MIFFLSDGFFGLPAVRGDEHPSMVFAGLPGKTPSSLEIIRFSKTEKNEAYNLDREEYPEGFFGFIP